MNGEFQSIEAATRQAAMNAADLLAPAQTTDEVKESLDMNSKGQVLGSIRNCKTVFANDPLLKGAVSRPSA